MKKPPLDANQKTTYREPFFLLLGTAMVLWLIWLGSRPVQTAALHGIFRHYASHVAAFGALAVTWSYGLPRVRALPLAIAIIAFGFAHEALEIVGHAHGFEFYDAFVDGAGATAGIIFAHAAKIRVRVTFPENRKSGSE
jgi:hypothetical protein